MKALRLPGSLAVKEAIQQAWGSRCWSKKTARSASTTSLSRRSLVIASRHWATLQHAEIEVGIERGPGGEFGKLLAVIEQLHAVGSHDAVEQGVALDHQQGTVLL